MAIATITLHATGKKISAELKPNGVGVIHFRPHANYQGEFGFDWVRDEIDPTPYNGIVGKYISKRDKKSKKIEKVFEPNEKNYKDLLKEYKTFKHPINTNDDYYIPYLTLLPNAEAKFTLHLDIKSYINEYHFEYDDTLFELSKTDLSEKEAGKYQTDFSIKCIKEFSKNQYVSIYGDGNLMGAIIILANNNIIKKDIVCYKVITTPREKVWEEDKVQKEKIEIHIKKYLSQFYVEPYIEFEDYIDYDKNIKLSNFVTKNHLLRQGSPPYIDTSQENFGGIYSVFENNFKESDDWYKIFVIPFAGGKIIDGEVKYASGYAKEIGQKIAIIFGTRYDIEVAPTHELLHCFGLPHTFEEGLGFVFEEEKTDNLMDYTKNIRVSSLFIQWKKVNSKINNNIEKIKPKL